MIKTIRIKNFQSHKRTELELDPHLTVITGSSNTGKSSIVRALKWLMLGVPKGTSFVSSGRPDAVITTFVSATMDDGVKVVRLVKNKKQVYKVIKPNGDDTFYENITNDIPEEVRNIFNVDMVNFASQYDPPFLISETPGAINEYFNGVLRLSFMDYLMSTLGKDQRDTNIILKQTQSDIEAYKSTLASYVNLKVVRKLMGKYRKITTQLTNLTEKRNALQSIVDKLVIVEHDLSVSSNLRGKVIPLYESIVSKHHLRVEYETKRLNLSSLISRIKQLFSLTLLRPPLLKSREIREKLLELQRFSSIIREKKDELSRFVLSYESLQLHTRVEKEDLRKERERWKKDFPETCPLCGSRINVAFL
jgi:exonuclease SbcC